MYGIDVADSRISQITDKILPLIKEWQERPLESVYAMMSKPHALLQRQSEISIVCAEKGSGIDGKCDNKNVY